VELFIHTNVGSKRALGFYSPMVTIYIGRFNTDNSSRLHSVLIVPCDPHNISLYTNLPL